MEEAREFIRMSTQFVIPHLNYEVNPDVSDFIDDMIAYFFRKLCDCEERPVEFHEYIPDICEYIIQTIREDPVELNETAEDFIHSVSFPENRREINLYFRMLYIADMFSRRDSTDAFFMVAPLIVYMYQIFYRSNNTGAYIMLVAAFQVIMVRIFNIRTVQDLEGIHNHARSNLIRRDI